MQSNYPVCYAAVRQYEGGNDDDPRDPGGRTSRGIIQREWDQYRLTHPGRPADVWQAPEADIAAIYRTDYWDRQWLDLMAAGPDETLFDYGVNSGTGRSQKVLRRCLHMADTAPVADVQARIARLTNDQVKVLVGAINDERLAFLQSLKTWPTFGRGWGRRVAAVRALSYDLWAQIPAPVIAAVPPEGSAKGQHAEPTSLKKVIKGSGPVIAGEEAARDGSGWLDWIAAHPLETAVIAVAAVVVIGGALYLINRWHKQRQEAPVPGWTPPPELKPSA